MEEYKLLKEAVLALEKDVQKYFEKDVKAAGVRVRRQAREINKLCQNLRAATKVEGDTETATTAAA